jgi:hypothetical protein
MKKLLCIIFVAGALAGCMPTKPDAPKGAADAAKKADEEKTVSAVPPVTPDTITEYNAEKKAQALEDELDRDAKKPGKALVEARK